jgi:alkanesulfonate monooxygenase SsuD/methylene tetrahydromethanopterin reductase-like flavin-dependent oxidoreductase (luciferase family)
MVPGSSTVMRAAHLVRARVRLGVGVGVGVGVRVGVRVRRAAHRLPERLSVERRYLSSSPTFGRAKTARPLPPSPPKWLKGKKTCSSVRVRVRVRVSVRVRVRGRVG